MPNVQNQEPVFVFGTDLAGTHKNETASAALQWHGAMPGIGSGAEGNSFAIPYRNSTGELMPEQVIQNYLDSFFRHAEARPDTTFQIARFCCEKNAHGDAVMAQLFKGAPANCQIPGLWHRALDGARPARVLLFDPGAHLKDLTWQSRLRKYVALNGPLWGVSAIELVSVGQARAVVANDIAAKKLGLKHRIFGTNERYYGRDAIIASETKAVWYSTHLLSIFDFEMTAQPQQIRVLNAATRGGLEMDQMDSNATG